MMGILSITRHSLDTILRQPTKYIPIYMQNSDKKKHFWKILTHLTLNSRNVRYLYRNLLKNQSEMRASKTKPRKLSGCKQEGITITETLKHLTDILSIKYAKYRFNILKVT